MKHQLEDRPMPTPHKHAEIIKAWADGAEIEYKSVSGSWVAVSDNPNWHVWNDYRVKPAVEIPEGFTPWQGGERPVDPKCFVKIKLRSGNFNSRMAEDFYWSNRESSNDIIAYKVLKNAPVVRWQWIVKDSGGCYATSGFFSESEIAAAYGKETIIGKAEWTRTEFEQ